MVEIAFDRFKLSARGVSRIIKTARTIADLRGGAEICETDIAEAIQYRVRETEA